LERGMPPPLIIYMGDSPCLECSFILLWTPTWQFFIGYSCLTWIATWLPCW